MQIKFFKTKKTFKKGGIHINPNIYWGICLGVAFVIVAASVVFGVLLFREINKELVIAAENNNTQIKKINMTRIEKVLNYFKERENESFEILNSPAPVVDPSL
jgi:preprotein translocase subunit Sec61beta